MGRRKTVPDMSESLRQAVRDSGKTLYRVSKDTGISWQALHRFMRGRTGLRMDLLDKLCRYLRLRLAEED
jgi:hypothetical protein